MIIQFNEVTKIYKTGTVAVEKLFLQLHNGEIYVLLGPNGAGKSTILKMLTTIIAPTYGRIMINGIDLFNSKNIEIQRTKRRIGYLPEVPYLFTKLTAEEHLDFIATLYGLPKKEKKDKIEYYLKFFKLEHTKNRYLETYSHGMQKKVAFIAAIIHSPDILILDEPTEGLDPDTTYKIKEILKEFRKKDKLILFTTHRLEIAEMLCTRVGILSSGKLLFVGTLSELRTTHPAHDTSLESLYLKLTSKQ